MARKTPSPVVLNGTLNFTHLLTNLGSFKWDCMENEDKNCCKNQNDRMHFRVHAILLLGMLYVIFIFPVSKGSVHLWYEGYTQSHTLLNLYNKRA